MKLRMQCTNIFYIYNNRIQQHKHITQALTEFSEYVRNEDILVVTYIV